MSIRILSKRISARVCALALAALLCACAALGEANMSADVFMERAGFSNDDAALRSRVEAFVEEYRMTEVRLNLMSDRLFQAYARNMELDLPLSYDDLISAPAQPLGAMTDSESIAQVLAIVPGDPASQCLIIDFERGWAYYDSGALFTHDVCRARTARRTDDVLEQTVRAALAQAERADWQTEYIGDASNTRGVPLVLAVQTDRALYRAYVIGRDNGAPQEIAETVRALMQPWKSAK